MILKGEQSTKLGNSLFNDEAIKGLNGDTFRPENSKETLTSTYYLTHSVQKHSTWF